MCSSGVVIVIDSSEEDEEATKLQMAPFKVRSGSARKRAGNGGGAVVDLSPGFRNAAAMAGWDDEALFMAACDEEHQPVATPDKVSALADRKREARTPGHAITPASANRVHRKPRRPHPNIIMDAQIASSEGGSVVNKLQKEIDRAGQDITSDCSLDTTGVAHTSESTVDSMQRSNERAGKPNAGSKEPEPSTSIVAENANPNTNSPPGTRRPPCLEQLRDELACAVCLEICFEPSTTSCGHSFCRSCLHSAVSRCGLRCPKCRQIIKEEGALNIVLWNTIQILFPEETAKRLDSRKDDDAAAATAAAAAAAAFAERRANAGRTVRQVQQPVDRNRPIGNFRRYAAQPLRSTRTAAAAAAAAAAASAASAAAAQASDLNARRQQEEVDALLAARLQEAEFLNTSSSSSSTDRRFQRRLRDLSHDQRIVESLAAAAANLRPSAARSRSQPRN